jgi:hypothetical protein
MGRIQNAKVKMQSAKVKRRDKRGGSVERQGIRLPLPRGNRNLRFPVLHFDFCILTFAFSNIGKAI